MHYDFLWFRLLEGGAVVSGINAEVLFMYWFIYKLHLCVGLCINFISSLPKSNFYAGYYEFTFATRFCATIQPFFCSITCNVAPLGFCF